MNALIIILSMNLHVHYNINVNKNKIDETIIINCGDLSPLASYLSHFLPFIKISL